MNRCIRCGRPREPIEERLIRAGKQSDERLERILVDTTSPQEQMEATALELWQYRHEVWRVLEYVHLCSPCWLAIEFCSAIANPSPDDGGTK